MKPNQDSELTSSILLRQIGLLDKKPDIIFGAWRHNYNFASALAAFYMGTRLDILRQVCELEIFVFPSRRNLTDK